MPVERYYPSTLRVKGVTKNFSGVRALDGVDFTCGQGEIQGLIGPNGAGKSSLVNVITGVLTPDEGEVLALGHNIAGKGPEAACLSGIARTFQNLRIFQNLSVRQYIEVALTTARHSGKSHAHSFDIGQEADRFSLADRLDLAAGTLSYGDQRRVEILRALASCPAVLLLDEPAAGMNDEESMALAQLIKSIGQRFGCGIIVIDHDLKFIMDLCETITVMDMGRVIASGTASAIRTNDRVIEVYLGSAAETLSAIKPKGGIHEEYC